MILAINHWGNPEPPPNSAIVNINYSTTWVLGIHNDQHDDNENQRIVIGYYEMVRLNLAEINEPYATYHTYEVALETVKKRLKSQPQQIFTVREL